MFFEVVLFMSVNTIVHCFDAYTNLNNKLLWQIFALHKKCQLNQHF